MILISFDAAYRNERFRVANLTHILNRLYRNVTPPEFRATDVQLRELSFLEAKQNLLDKEQKLLKRIQGHIEFRQKFYNQSNYHLQPEIIKEYYEKYPYLTQEQYEKLLQAKQAQKNQDTNNKL